MFRKVLGNIDILYIKLRSSGWLISCKLLLLGGWHLLNVTWKLLATFIAFFHYQTAFNAPCVTLRINLHYNGGQRLLLVLRDRCSCVLGRCCCRRTVHCRATEAYHHGFSIYGKFFYFCILMSHMTLF